MLAASSGCLMISPMRGGRPLGNSTRVVDGKLPSFSALPEVWIWSNFEMTNPSSASWIAGSNTSPRLIVP